VRRRDFIKALSAWTAAWPLWAHAQDTARLPHVGVLLASEENDRDLQQRLTGFRQGLARLGWTDGRNIRVEYRFGAGNPEWFQPLAKELVAKKPDVILAQTPAMVAAVQRESSSIPLIFIDVPDPIAIGLVTSLARPSGNATGLLSFEKSIGGKWLAMLKELSPELTRVALVGNPKTTAYEFYYQAIKAQPLGIELIRARVETAVEIERAIESAAQSHGGAIFLPDSTIILHRDLIVALAARHKLPTIYPFRFFVTAGGLMSYSIDFVFQYRQAASYVDRIVRGARPSYIPVQAPTKFETILNLKAAKAIGVSVPPALLVAADEVIE